MSKISNNLTDQVKSGNCLRGYDRVRKKLLPVDVPCAPKKKKTGSLQKDSRVFEDSTTSSYSKSPVGIVTVKDAATHYGCRWNFISGCCSANRDGELI